MRCFSRLKDNPAGKSLTWFKAVGKGFIERVPGGASIFRDGSYQSQIKNTAGTDRGTVESPVNEPNYVLRAFLQIWSTWRFQERFWVIRIPRNLADETRSIGWLFRCRIMSGKGFFLVEITMGLVLAALAVSWLLLNQLWMVLISAWKSDKSDGWERGL